MRIQNNYILKDDDDDGGDDNKVRDLPIYLYLKNYYFLYMSSSKKREREWDYLI